MNTHNRSALIITSFVVFIVSLGLVFSLYLLSQNQDIRNRASIGFGDARDACITEECRTTIAAQEDPSLFVSEEGRYAVRMNPEIWKQRDLPENASQTDREPAFFVMRTSLDFATVYLASYDYPPELLDATGSFNGNTSEFITYLEQNIPETYTVARGITGRYLGAEEVQINDLPAIRLMFEESVVNSTTPYDEYILLGDSIYLEAELRYTMTREAESAGIAFIEGIHLSSSSVLGAETEISDKARLTELVKPSVVQVTHVYCRELVVVPASVFLIPKYEFCWGGEGTGFMVGDEGYVATNGHVVKTYPEQDLIGGLMSGNTILVRFLVHLVQELYYQQADLFLSFDEASYLTSLMVANPSQQAALIAILYEMLDQEFIKVNPTESIIFVNAGLQHPEVVVDEINRFTVNRFYKKTDTIFEAEVVALDYGNMFEKDFLLGDKTLSGSDVALLKLSNPNGYTFPALNIAKSESVKEGEQITILGFPGVVDERESYLFNAEKSGKNVTITQGVISSIKRDHENRFLLQTDASVSHGNSGGPAFNNKGEVIGIVTYGLGDGSGNYNLLRATEDLLGVSLMNNVNLESQPRRVYDAWTTGLDYYWNNRFTRSIAQFQLVQSEYPIHPTVTGIVLAAEDSVEAGLDADYIYGIEKNIFYGGIGLMAGIVFFGLVLILLVVARKRKTSHSPQPAQNPQPMISPVAEQQSAPTQPVSQEPPTLT